MRIVESSTMEVYIKYDSRDIVLRRNSTLPFQSRCNICGMFKLYIIWKILPEPKAKIPVLVTRPNHFKPSLNWHIFLN